MRAQLDDMMRISTHAPAGGATSPPQTWLRSSREFLLTPLREGRLGGGGNYQLQAKFLLTPLREGRPRAATGSASLSRISTHAPAGGATHSRKVAARNCFYFYSRPCGRGDPPSRLPSRPSPNFYSRPCGRGDHHVHGYAPRPVWISTHAPAGGAT